MKLFKKFRKTNEKSKKTQETASAELPPAYTSDWTPEQTEKIITETTNAAFLEAWRLHWSDLDESEKVEWSFREVKSPLKVQRTIQGMDKLHREHLVSRKIAAKTLRFLQALETLMAGAAIGIQSCPDCATALASIAKVAVKYLEYYEKLSQMLERLAEHIVIFDLYAKNNSDEKILHQTLVALYKNVLAFCRYARRAFIIQGDSIASNSLSMFARVQWAPFEKQFGQIQSNLEHYTKSLGMVSTAMTLNSTLAIRDDLDKIHLLDIEKNFLEWICKEDTEEIHGIVRQKRHANTGLWLFNNSSYKTWISERVNHPLWLVGPAGTGKSVIASMVIDHFKNRPEYANYTVAYVYFRGEEVTTDRFPSRLVSMLIKQLCWNLSSLPETTVQAFRDFNRNSRQPTFESLKLILMDCASNLENVIVVLDAFNECKQTYRKQLSEFIRELVAKCVNVKVFVTSRWERDIKSFLQIPNSMWISNEPSAEDIGKIIRDRVKQEFGHITPDLREKIISELIEKSSGSFLWVDLQLNDLAQTPQSDIEVQLTMIPTGLSNTYIECLRKIHAQPRTTRNLAKTCFLWVLNSYNIFSRNAFLDAISLEAKLSGDKKKNYSWMEVEGATKQLIIGPGFLFGRVRPLHFSFKEFASNRDCHIPPELQDYLPDSETAHARLAIECLQHLMLDIHAEDELSSAEFYCAHYFDRHIRELTIIPDEVLTLLDQLLTTDPNRLMRIMGLRWPIGYETFPDVTCLGNPSSVDPFFFMQCTRLNEMPAIWSRFSHLKPLKPYPESYLHLAVISGSEGPTSEMIAQGVDVNRLDSHKYAPIHVAIHEWVPISIFKMLVENGADLYLQGKSGNVIKMATTHKDINPEIPEFLKQRGVTE